MPHLKAEWEKIISWCIAESLEKTLLLQIEGHWKEDPLGGEIYDVVRDEIDPAIFQFHAFCIADKLCNPCLPFIYFRKAHSVYLISPEV